MGDRRGALQTRWHLSACPVLAVRYSDDEPGSPWSWIIYLDAQADDDQQAKLEAIFTGRLGGDAVEHFPWAWKESKRIAVRSLDIEVDHTYGARGFGSATW